jgi:hypothetical protein
MFVYKERNVITIYKQLYLTCENSYMFRLYIQRHHQAGYRTLKETIKYNKIVGTRSLLHINVYIHRYRNLKRKLYNCNANVCFIVH